MTTEQKKIIQEMITNIENEIKTNLECLRSYTKDADAENIKMSANWCTAQLVIYHTVMKQALQLFFTVVD